MLELMQFVFSSFWVWAGTVILIAAIGQAAIYLLTAIREFMR